MNKVFLILILFFAQTLSALTKQELNRFNEVTKNLTPTFRYNMNVALFKGDSDSTFIVSNDGRIIKGLSQYELVIFNSNLQEKSGSIDELVDLIERSDLDMDGEYPLVIRDITDLDSVATYAIRYNGDVVVKKGIYDGIECFVDGYAKVCKDHLWGVINKEGAVVVPLSLHDCNHIFINHNVWIYAEGISKWQMLNEKGEVVCSYDEVDYNIDKRLKRVEKNLRSFFKNRSLGVTIVRDGDKWGAVDKEGKIVVPIENDKHSVVYRAENGMWFYGESVFSPEGKTIIKPIDPRISSYIAFNHILTEKVETIENAQVVDFALYDFNGKQVDNFTLPNGFKWCLVGNEWVLRNSYGQLVAGSYIDVVFKHDCPLKDINPWSGNSSDSFFKVFDEGVAGMIDMNGKLVLPMKFSSCRVVNDLFQANVLKNGVFYIGYFDLNGNEIVPVSLYRRFAYENFGWHYEGTDCTLDAYQVNGKWGLLDMETKKTVVPFCLDDVLAFMHGVGVVKYKGRLYYINEKGEGLPNEAYMTK